MRRSGRRRRTRTNRAFSIAGAKLAADGLDLWELRQQNYSDRSACMTSTREARAAGISDARIAAETSTSDAPASGSHPAAGRR